VPEEALLDRADATAAVFVAAQNDVELSRACARLRRSFRRRSVELSDIQKAVRLTTKGTKAHEALSAVCVELESASKTPARPTNLKDKISRHRQELLEIKTQKRPERVILCLIAEILVDILEVE
jgi:hypothetical protein